MKEPNKKVIHKSPTQTVYSDGTSDRYPRQEPTSEDWEKEFDKLSEEKDILWHKDEKEIIEQFISDLLIKEREKAYHKGWIDSDNNTPVDIKTHDQFRRTI